MTTGFAGTAGVWTPERAAKRCWTSQSWRGSFIENVYNSKVLVGMEDYIRRGKVQGNVCYLHTGGFGSLFSQFYTNSI